MSTSTPSPRTNPSPATGPAPAGIDPRGPRVGAGVTAVLLAVTLVLGTSTAAAVLLTVIALLFAVGVARGAQGSIQGLLYRTLVRPRLAAPSELEDPRPPRFAQLIGLIVTAPGAVLGLAGIGIAVPIAAGIALVAAFLNAVFGLCLGCELYLLIARARGRASARASVPASATPAA